MRKGEIRPWGKTKKCLPVIHIPKESADDLEDWRKQYFAPSSEAFIFVNRDGGFLDTDNYRKRVLRKLARDLKLPKLTFQVILRTIATLVMFLVETKREVFPRDARDAIWHLRELQKALHDAERIDSSLPILASDRFRKELKSFFAQRMSPILRKEAVSF